MTTKNIIGIETKRRFKVVDTIDDLEKLANQEIITTATPKIINPKTKKTKIYTSNSTMDEMVDYFISKGKDYYANSPRESLEKLRADKGKDALIMTFAEAVKKYNMTKEDCWNTTDNVYFRLLTFEGKKIINLSGTGVSIPKTYEDALNIYVDLKKQKYQGKTIEVLMNEDINTKNATQHTFAVIIDDILEASGKYKIKDWCNNTFVKFINGGKSGLKELAKEYGYDKLGSEYYFNKSEDKMFEVGCVVHHSNFHIVLYADIDNDLGQFRG